MNTYYAGDDLHRRRDERYGGRYLHESRPHHVPVVAPHASGYYGPPTTTVYV